MCASGPIHSAATSGVGVIGSVAAGRIHVYDWLFGHVGAADDNVIANQVSRFTTAVPTGSAVTPIGLDLSAASHGTTTLSGSTGGTVTGCLISIPTNQRASHRWVAAPDGELVLPSTVNTGILYTAVHASLATNMQTTFHWVS